MRVRFLKPGIHTTVQDRGRWAHLADAVPVCGVMDQLSAAIANIACGNEMSAAVLEFTYFGASFYSETDILIAYAGGSGAILNCGDEVLPFSRPVFIPAGSAINFLPNETGCRTYLAIAGGWNVPEILGSRSTCLVAGFGGFEGRALKKGDVVESNSELSAISLAVLNSLRGGSIKSARWNIAQEMFLPVNRKTIRIIPGPEFTWFSATSILKFLSAPFRLSADCNRMGYRLEGEQINLINKKELISTALTQGTIQVSGNGSLILLMADCQTTGGYPRIAQVAAVDLPLCAQLKPGDGIFFSEISRHEAETLYIEQQEELVQLQEAIKMKYDVR